MNEDIEKFLEKQEENQCLLNLNQELEKEIKKLTEEKKSQDERFEKFQRKNNLLENKIVQIQRETSILSEKQIQVKEVKEVLSAVKKEEKKTTHTPYKHPNCNRHFDQRKGQIEHSQKSYVEKKTIRHTKQQLRQPVYQNYIIGPIKMDLGWTTTDTMWQFS